MNRIFVLSALLAGSLAITSGCATKNYVRGQVSPEMNKINNLDDQTARTTRDIHDLDTRTQTQIADVNAHSDAADQRAQTAGQQADQAMQMTSTNSHNVDTLTERVVNFDNYHPVSETSVHFAFNRADLNKDSRAALDQLALQVPSARGWIIQIEGDTDSVGSQDYNYGLSQRRASAVIQYLAEKHSIPAHRIYVIGLGKDHPVAANSTSKGRAENRRVDVRLMTNIPGQNARQESAQQ